MPLACGGTRVLQIPESGRDKLAAIRDRGADTVVANDAGCLMHIGGGLSRAGLKIETRHLAEVLASR